MSLSSASLNLEGSESPVFADTPHFEVSIAHYFILGAALFSIFWGVVNAVLVSFSNHNLTFFHRSEESTWTMSPPSRKS